MVLVGDLMKKIKFLIIIALIFLTTSCSIDNKSYSDEKLKIHWFIPDGMRADPELFNIYEWANQGDLPNIKKLMDQGSYGYSIPTFPSHTPTNFATLLTGTYPKTHGVADGPMHIEGRPLNKVAVGGFSSVAKKVEPIWVTFENQGANVLLLSMPGSTPPELEKGITIKGRWGGWGPDFHAINFEEKLDLTQRKIQGRGNRLFFFGPELTKYLDASVPSNWSLNPLSYSPSKEIKLDFFGSSLYGYIYDSKNNGLEDYDRILFSFDKKNKLGVLKQGEWSSWNNVSLKWNNFDVTSDLKINLIKLDEKGFFRIRVLFNTLNEFNSKPSTAAQGFVSNVGPMVDFVDNFPPQLIYYDEDKETFLHEMNMSFDWHKDSVKYIKDNYDVDVVIHDIYSPNQMLTSRWWLGYIDPSSQRYNDISEEERNLLFNEVKNMYKELDNIIGEILKNNDENTLIIISSDHGAVPLDKWVRLNNLFSEKGWLKFKINNETGEPIIDWENSTVIYLKMDNIYVNPKGLAGNWTRGSGEKYELLREEVTNALLELVDEETKIKPIKAVVKWEEVKEYLDLPEDRVGDLVVANVAGYGWNEEMTKNLEIFSIPLKTGYKQAIFANETKGMWTPFMIMGPGVKKGYFIENPIQHVDQYTTIMSLSGYELSHPVEGELINSIIK